VARLNDISRPTVEELSRLLGNVRAIKLGLVTTDASFDADDVQYVRPSPSEGIMASHTADRLP
jgi:hypothetical protein